MNGDRPIRNISKRLLSSIKSCRATCPRVIPSLQNTLITAQDSKLDGSEHETFEYPQSPRMNVLVSKRFTDQTDLL